VALGSEANEVGNIAGALLAREVTPPMTGAEMSSNDRAAVAGDSGTSVSTLTGIIASLSDPGLHAGKLSGTVDGWNYIGHHT
jgi:ABC-type thiamine transport system ATPase subunit